MADIAFFGLGTMGLPMALNVLKAGHHVRVVPHRGRMEAPLKVREHGGSIHKDVSSMLAGVDFVISVVSDDAAVREIYLNDAARDAMRPGAVIIEMTSCSPQTVRDVEEYYNARNVHVIDAPITGALPKAIDGTLTIMGAGRAEDFQRAEPVFASMAQKVFQLGPVGNGKLIKAMTNLLGAINLAAVGEFYRFASAMGLDMDILREVVDGSAGGSTQFSRNFDRMAEARYTPAAFTLSLLRKDMGIAMACAAQVPDLAMPLAEAAYELYTQAAPHDLADCSAIALYDGRRHPEEKA